MSIFHTDYLNYYESEIEENLYKMVAFDSLEISSINEYEAELQNVSFSYDN